MTTRVVHRPARTVHAPPERAVQQIEAPPALPESGTPGGQLMTLLPMAGMMSSLTVMTVLRNRAFMALGAVMLVVAVLAGGMLLISRRGQAARQRRGRRERYLDHLEELRETLAAGERERRAAARVLNPPPEALYDVLRDPARLWERRRRDADFLRVRIGIGLVPGQPLEVGVQASAMTPADPFMMAEARALAARFGTAPDMPLVLPLDMAGDVSVVGPREDALRLLRAMIGQLAAFHAPEDVAIAYGGRRVPDWDWLKWLPHAHDQRRRDCGAPLRLVATSPQRIAALLADDLRARADLAAEVARGLGTREALGFQRRLVLIHDTHGEPASELARPDPGVPVADLAATVVHLVERREHEPGEVNIRILVDGDRVEVTDLRGEVAVTMSGTVDHVPPGMLEGLARMLAPLRLSRESAEESAAQGGEVDFASLVGLENPAHVDVARSWAPRSERAFLRVPIGLDEGGRPVILDLKEASSLGMGPHGLCVGATGSGKSELLRTLVLALACTHSPEQVSMVLVDYKGGATFAPFGSLPHVAGVITNLEDDAGLIERAYASLAGEVQRRQQVLRDAGNIASVGDYNHLRAERPELPPLPHLLVIIDEFGELLTARPDFVELFLSIGRIGRSIGVHLLLSSQRVESGKLRGLETYLSYRIGLRTFSEEESRTVLGTTDAFHLPALPGFGYLKVDTSVYTKFKGGYVSGAYRNQAAADEEPVGQAPPVHLYPVLNRSETARRRTETEGDGTDEPSLPERTTGPTLLDVTVESLSRHGRRVQTIWLPPLPSLVTLENICGPVQVTAAGMHLPDARGKGLEVPVGLLDDARRQWQDVWRLDLTAAGGHVAIIGGPQTGKTTLLRTLTLSLALTRSPSEVSVYGLDLVGGGLQALEGLPNVGGIAGRTDYERIRRTVEEVHGMLEHRQEVFRNRGIDGVARLRRMHADGLVPELPCADVVLLVDGFGAIRTDVEEIDDMVADLLQRGGGYGVHVVAGMLRWNDVRIAAQSTFGQRVELRLNDPSDSTVDRKLAQTISADLPGRVLTEAKLFAQVAVPAIGGAPDPSVLGEAMESAVGRIRVATAGPVAAQVRVLPHRLPAHDLPGPADEPRLVPIGVDERHLAPVSLDLFGGDQNLLVLGDGGCGKTNLLRLIVEGLMARHTPGDVVFAVMDPRRTLRDVIPAPYLGGYATTPRVCAGLAANVAQELQERMPDDVAADGDGTVPAPRIVILADDYDLLTTAGQQPLAPFLPFVAGGRDIGVHFVVTRRVAGASRGMYDPLVQAMREIGTGALLMSGDRSEGQLFPRVYAGPQPPGRGLWLTRRDGPRLIQTALLDEPPGVPAPRPSSLREA
ncbi:type VII secretion protein EccCa [Actinomadura montaniterrae]|uniref:Type VII secretion protein EccCa n=1 Tax=Actinomadura montaniterrae TaxID=1803903 RepID=A0A6L3W2N9_9ACTN|nr:type VII secretion protein EccCa [Actinomadura montaniterrae]KAB2388805.1 type VII secretion protein EccCa [Actinomadura montaniterrae]